MMKIKDKSKCCNASLRVQDGWIICDWCDKNNRGERIEKKNSSKNLRWDDRAIDEGKIRS